MNLIEEKGNQICCFFGHRNTPIDILPLLQKEVEKLIVQYDVKKFYVGGYGDFDSYAVETVNKIKKQYTDIKLFLIPAYITTLEREKDYISKTYDDTIFPNGLETTLQRFAIVKRNHWIVEQCQYVIVYVNHSWGGANTAFQYARRKKRSIINLAEIKVSKVKTD